ncbi:uncharacterized protein [Drosophila takahashii]|uniref:uncharacterized protein n=1 Tax=Drosophila takahashii TaxID=29030 RepID=UPI001CF7FB16|nr:uncharacterized protein LOC108060454 [Drosophila takahashii]
MNNDELVDFTDLISSKSGPLDLRLPDVRHIKDIGEFMSDPKNFNGDINKLTDGLEAKAQQCRNVLKILKERLQLKTATMQKVKTDVMELDAEIKKPGAENRFVTNHEKVKLHFLDETDSGEYNVPEALERYSVKMSSLYREILALDSDVDCVSYLVGVAQINIDYVKDWYKTKIQNKTEKSLPDDVGDSVKKF